MKPHYPRRIALDRAPQWAEQSAPRNLLARTIPSLLLIHLPEEECWVVADIGETNAIADPNSYLGRLLRAHSALMSLPYSSDN
jgi:hypothetical protein